MQENTLKEKVCPKKGHDGEKKGTPNKKIKSTVYTFLALSIFPLGLIYMFMSA